jgi:hypothetical protein
MYQEYPESRTCPGSHHTADLSRYAYRGQVLAEQAAAQNMPIPVLELAPALVATAWNLGIADFFLQSR